MLPKESVSTLVPPRGGSGSLLENARRGVTVASPASLRSSILLLTRSQMGNSREGTELLFVALSLMERIYPLELQQGEKAVVPPDTVYRMLLTALDSGELPTIPADSTSFFTTMLTPLVLLNTDDPELLSICREITEGVRSLIPDSVLPVLLLGILSEKELNYPDALTLYKEALSMEASCYPAEVGMARIYIETGEIEFGVSLLDQLLMRYPGERTLILQLAEGYYHNGRYSSGLELIESFREGGEDPDLFLMRAMLLERTGDYAGARAALSQLEELPESPEKVVLQARLMVEKGDVDGAVAIFREGVKLFPDAPQIKEFGAELMQRTGRDPLSENVLTLSMDSDPESLVVIRDRAARDGDFQMARRYSDRLISVAPSTDALIQGAQLSLAEGDLQHLNRLLDRVEKVANSDYRVVLLRGQYYLALGEVQAAREMFNEIAEGDYPPVAKSSAYYLISRTLLDEDARIKALQTSLLENIENRDTLLELATIYISSADYTRAIRYLKQANRFSPDDPEVERVLREAESAAEGGVW